MPRSYSQDLREKLMSQLESGRLPQGQAGGLLSASPRTISRRLRRCRATGSHARPPNTRRRLVVQGPDSFREKALSRPDQTQSGLAEFYGASRSVIHRALGRAGISYKKNLLVPGEGPRGSWGVSLGTPEDPRRAAPLHGRAGSR